jgi:hypothetical protein
MARRRIPTALYLGGPVHRNEPLGLAPRESRTLVGRARSNPTVSLKSNTFSAFSLGPCVLAPRGLDDWRESL